VTAVMGDCVVNIRLRYVNEFVDRHGKPRRYFRRRGFKPVPLPGIPGSIEFMEAYQRALESAEPIKEKRTQRPAGTFGRLVTDYRASAMFKNLAPKSQQTYDKVLNALTEKHGHRIAADLTPEAARRIIERIGAKRPAMANLTASVLRRVMSYAVKTGLRRDNPMVGIEKYRGGEHHTWIDEELATYEAHWAVGTRERLMFALLLYTGQRIGDVARLTRSNIKDGEIHLVQQKTGIEMTIAIRPELAEAIAAMKPKGLPLIAAESGRALAVGSLYQAMVKAIAAAGLPSRCVPHGLRKALLRRLAEHGATTKQLQAVSGHSTLAEVERYTRRAEQASLNRAALDLLPAPARSKNRKLQT